MKRLHCTIVKTDKQATKSRAWIRYPAAWVTGKSYWLKSNKIKSEMSRNVDKISVILTYIIMQFKGINI